MKAPEVRTLPILARSQVLQRSWPVVIDLAVAATGMAAFVAVVHIATYWMRSQNPAVTISLDAQSLPLYAFYSIIRIGVAYLLSLAFAVGYGYIAAYNPRIESIMLAVLDILQSIPVLSFLPGVMLAMVAIFPTRQLGLELGAIVLIFTGQVWNMAFSFYASLKSIPRELIEASHIYRLSAWQRFWQLELPFSAIGLVWNSMISVAGGWFFLMACEMFVLGDHDFRLPGLGSYLQTAASAGNMHAMLLGILTVVLIIVATDFLLWRPVIAWSERFRFEQVDRGQGNRPIVLNIVEQSRFLALLRRKMMQPISERIYKQLAARRSQGNIRPVDTTKPNRQEAIVVSVLTILALCAVLFGTGRALSLLRQISGHELGMLLLGAAATFGRVNLSLLVAAAWTIPCGVAIGMNPRLARIAQPLAQIAASLPATAFFPILLLALGKIGAGLGIGSIMLMLLGTQWYILFNVIAGATAIPADMLEVARLFRFSRWQRWRTVILPGIFPYLATGLVTASGGAWNASIVAEYFHLTDRTLGTFGLGEQISAATDAGHFPVLLLGTIIMALMVITINRLLWRPMFRLAETRYRLDG